MAKLGRKRIWTVRDRKLKVPIRGLNQHIIFVVDYDVQPEKTLANQKEFWHFHIALRFEKRVPALSDIRTILDRLWDGTTDVQDYVSAGASTYGYSKHRNQRIDIGCPRTGACNRNGRTCIYERRILELTR